MTPIVNVFTIMFDKKGASLDTIYVVMGSYGDYDAFTEWVERAFFDRNKAEKYTLLLANKSERLTRIRNEFANKMNEWEKKRPYPTRVLRDKEKDAKTWEEWHTQHENFEATTLNALGVTKDELVNADKTYEVCEVEIE